MELDIALSAATTTTPSAIVNNNQENNQLLLNAIKNKFSAQTASEAAAFSPPKFNIPLLKIPGQLNNSSNSLPTKTVTLNTNNKPEASSQLNQFLLKQLQEKHTTNGLVKENKATTGFVLPQLQTTNSNNKQPIKFELPSTVSSLTSSLNKLQVQESSSKESPKTPANSTPAIDLTTALASKLHSHQGTPPTRDFVKPLANSEKEQDFVIPFIDCDRLDNAHKKAAFILPTSNEYCITDISQLMLKHSFVEEPSVIGRFLNTDEQKYLPPSPLPYLKAEYHQQKVKHFIKPFAFDTKSPDDLVLEALNKYQRRHYN